MLAAFALLAAMFSTFPGAAAVAAGAIVNVANAFLGMLGNDLRLLMLMAAIAGHRLELITLMACRASDIMVGI